MTSVRKNEQKIRTDSNNHMKRGTQVFILRKIQVKQQWNAIRMVKITKCFKSKYWRACGEQELSFIVGWNLK